MRIFIGYDSKEPLAYHVLAHSILTRATSPISITPLTLSSLKGLYTRQRGPTESTEFSLTRFLVPYLSGYEGWSLFMDCDMLCLTDIWRVLDEGSLNKAISVCQHQYQPKSITKFLGQVQTAYPRKNWSSLILFDNEKCQVLTPDYVNSASGLDLHRFNWLSEDQIGQIDLAWNWLVGEYEPNPDAKILHYTLGGPWFPEYDHSDHADLWFREKRLILGDP
jgi:hypothetical protein